MLCRERTVKPYLYETDLLALFEHVVDDFFCCITYRAHGDDDLFSIRSAIVVEELVVCADLLVDLVHVVFHYARECFIVLV